MTRLAIFAVAIGLAACGAPPPSQPSAATQAACRSRADEVYLRQNRQSIYRADDYAGGIRDAPYATTGLPGITTNGLADRYDRDEMVRSCLNGTENNGEVVPSPGVAPGPPTR
ncbi:MAG: hypothetical protein JO264_09795 [Acidisphaera sp.]|nr:hypothetical protein [Acidisphaera sp.]